MAAEDQTKTAEEQAALDQAAAEQKAQEELDAKTKADAEAEAAAAKQKADDEAAAIAKEKKSSSRQGSAKAPESTGVTDEPVSGDDAVTPEPEAQKYPEAVAVNPLYGALTSAMAATGDVVHVPDSPDAIAEQATALGLANDHATGGYAPPTDTTDRQPVYTRVWAMDNDHTEKNRSGFDPVKPDCVTVS